MLAVLALLGALGGVAHRFAPLVEAARFAAVAPASELRSKAAPSSPFSDGTWCSSDALAALSDELLALSAEPESWWAQAPRAFSTIVCADERCLVSLFAIPDGCRVPLRTHPVGTVILHRALAGAFELSRWQLPSPADRSLRRPVRVMRRESGTEAEQPLCTFGGLAQELEAARGGVCAVLEVALLSPVVPVTGPGAVEIVAASPAYGSAAEPPQLLEATSAEQLLARVLRAAIGGESGGSDDSDGDAEARAARERAAAAELRRPPLERLALAVGGLAPELAAIDRRILAPRQQSAGLLEALGVSVPRGLLLHGPPGCGKTLLAREIGRTLGAASVQVVSGPEMMSRFVGESERWVRELFEPAERDAREAAEKAGALDAADAQRAAARLHVIILDELDAFSRERGSLVGDPGIRDSIVNTLLAKMDGVSALDNLLVIGTTNRIELIDRALLRAGRFEVHVRVRPPSQSGRAEVLGIHLRRMRAEGLLGVDADSDEALAELAAASDGFTGADLAGLVRSAASRALQRAAGEQARGGGGAARPVVRRADLALACAEVGRQTQAVRERSALAAALCPTHEWEAEDVCAWLHEADAGAGAQAAFREQAMDGRALCQLARMDGSAQERLLAEQLGVRLLGERLRFLHALRELMARPVELSGDGDGAADESQLVA